MSDNSTPQVTRRQFLGAAASIGALVGGVRLPIGAIFAPSFVNCDARFLRQLAGILSEKPDLSVTLFLTVGELGTSDLLTSRQVEVGFRPSSPQITLDYAQWIAHQQKPLFATAEQGALWPKLASLCAAEEILLASWDGLSEEFEVGNQTPLFDGATIDLAKLFLPITKSQFLAGKSLQKIMPLHALAQNITAV